MTFLSLEPFIPSGKDFQKSKQLLADLGFELDWEEPGLAGFRNGTCQFILQEYDSPGFAENLMLAVKVPDINLFWENISQKNLSEKYGIPQIGQPTERPYGKEVNVIDAAGVCWHFIENQPDVAAS